VDQSFHEYVIEENENPEGSDAGNRAEKIVSEMPLHVFDLFKVHAFSFGCLGDPFAYAATLGSVLETRSLPVFRNSVTLDERVHENPVKPEIRIPPNRGREVGISV
tara:strand:- start:19 stop:336 length:318 start_codon:yes stop_codon:yes gene_type:complete